MDRDRLGATVLGFAAAGLLLAALLALVGVEELLAELRRGDTRLVALAIGLVCLWLVWWGLALWIVLGSVGIAVSPIRGVLTFAAAMFANNVTPFGQAGGEPITAFLIAESTDAAYERGLAAIASVDALNLVPSIALALTGVAYVAATRTLGGTGTAAALTVLALAVGVPAALFLAWTSRDRLESGVVAALTPVAQWVGAVVPRLSAPGRDDVENRVAGFFTAVERVGADPRRLALALGCSTAGWICQVVALWIALRAVGAPVPLAVPMVVVPLGAVAGIAPLPGGAGGIEGMLVALLVAAPIGVTEATALAAVVIFRGSVYWLPTLLGGAVTGVVAARASRSRRAS